MMIQVKKKYKPRDEIIIGTGKRLCSASKIRTLPGEHSIYENSTAYWISDCYFGLRLTIYKNDSYAEELSNMIDSGASVKNIMDWVDSIVIQKLTSEEIKEFVSIVKKNAYENGRQDKAKEIRTVLGISGEIC